MSVAKLRQRFLFVESKQWFFNSEFLHLYHNCRRISFNFWCKKSKGISFASKKSLVLYQFVYWQSVFRQSVFWLLYNWQLHNCTHFIQNSLTLFPKRIALKLTSWEVVKISYITFRTEEKYLQSHLHETISLYLHEKQNEYFSR